jgi:hypothetical protein
MIPNLHIYHSSSVLLMDGSVWTAGQTDSSYCGQIYIPKGGKNVEIYRPDYYFDSDRPEIADSPAAVQRGGDPFTVEFTVGDGRAFSHAALISYSAVTHSVNMTQRYLILNMLDIVGNEVELEAPPVIYAPPGPYMLVVVDDEGIPSIAKSVMLE